MKTIRLVVEVVLPEGETPGPQWDWERIDERFEGVLRRYGHPGVEVDAVGVDEDPIGPVCAGRL